MISAPRMRGRAAGRATTSFALLVVTTVGLAFVTLGAGLSSAGAADGRPTLTVTSPRVAIDSQIQLEGAGFQPSSELSVEFCGVPGPDGRLSCAPAESTVSSSLSGNLVAEATVREPAGDCPCVVKVTAPGQPPVTAPIQIASHPMAERATAPQLVVEGARIEGATGLVSLFTGKADAELVLTFSNAGVAPAQPTLQLGASDPDSADEATAIDDPGVPEVAPGGRSTTKVPVEVGGLFGGSTSVTGYAVVGDFYSPVQAGVTVRPWGLYLLLLAGLGAGALLFLRRRSVPAERTVATGSSHRASGRAPVAAAAPVPARSLFARQGTAHAATAPAAPAPRAPLVPAARSGAVESERTRTGGLNLGAVARAAADAAAQVAAAARAAEAREAAEERDTIRSEVAEIETDARLEALSRDDFLRPAQPAPEAEPAPVAEKSKRGRRDRHAVEDDAMVGPPRLAETPIDRSVLGGAAPAPAAPAATVQAAADEDVDAVTAYLRATSPETLAAKPPRPAYSAGLPDIATGPLPVVVPPPLTLPAQGGHAVAPPPAPPAPSAYHQGGQLVSATQAPLSAEATVLTPAPAESVTYEQAQANAASTMAEALRQRSAARDAAIVGEAMEAIRTHTADDPGRLPDPHQYVPTQRDRRAPKGGKRAAR